MAKSGFAEIGEYNPRQDCEFKKRIDAKGKTVTEHIGIDGTSDCSLEEKYGAVDPYSSMGYFTTVCQNHSALPEGLMTRMAEMHRSFPEDTRDLPDEKSRVNREVERQRIDNPLVERRKRIKEELKRQRSRDKDVKNYADYDLFDNSDSSFLDEVFKDL